MAKSKKKKNVQSQKSLESHLEITKTYFDDFVKTAHKFMLLIGLQPADFDTLSKRTKQALMLKHTPYRVRAEKDHCVPHAYLKFFNSFMSRIEKTTFYGDPIFKITFLEYVTLGLPLIFSIRNFRKNEAIIGEDQAELLDRIRIAIAKYMSDHEEQHHAVRTGVIMKCVFIYVAKPNYRYYSAKEGSVRDYLRGRIENVVTVSTIEPERKKFVIDGKTHTAYRVGYYNVYLKELTIAPEMAEIQLKLLVRENSKPSKQLMNQIKRDTRLPVFIQNHALNRAAERMDCKDNMYINLILAFSFHTPIVVTATNGQRLIGAFDITGKVIGYFPFNKQDGAVLILSFLPLSSPITPEGSVLQKELGIQLEDSKYIGLDKFSFYTKTDFDTLPKLKQALKKAGMWHLTELKPINPMERKEDHILKNFFMDNISEPEFVEEYS